MLKKKISRRTMLRGWGHRCLALARSDGPGDRLGGSATARPRPRRTAWRSSTCPTARTWPTGRRRPKGPTSSCRRSSNRWKALKDDFLVLTGLTADKARAHGDGGGDHARALAAFLTGCQPRKTDGTDIRAGISVDQVAAARIGDQTRLASLEIGCEHGAMAGNCDSGYSCVYSSTMSWRSATQPLPKEVNPKLVFERLFGAGAGCRPGQTRSAAQEHPRFCPRGRQGSAQQARRQRPAQAGRILHRRPRHRAAHRAGGEAAAGEDARLSKPAGSPGQVTRSTSS